ncbi:MAG: Crp/Fnr family transcriptional regulator [Bdellovibrionales bacterium]
MTHAPREFLQYSQILEHFPLQIRNTIYAKAEYKDFKPGDCVFKIGDEGNFMAGVMSGRLRMSVKSLEGKEMLVTMVNRGEVFGEMSILDGMPRAVNVVAETDCTLLVVRRDDFIPLLRMCPEAMLGLIRITCYRMRRYLHIMELIALQNLPVRLGHYLLRLAHDYGVEKDGKIVISPNMSQAAIGQHIAISREGVNKQLRDFADKGLLSLDGNDIILHDIEALKKFIAPSGD